MRVRTAVPADAPNVARMQVRSWQAGYRGLLPQPYLDGLDPVERVDRYTFDATLPQGPYTLLVVEDAGAIAGQVTIGRCRDHGLEDHGEVWALYVDPDRWGRGVGRILMDAAREELVRNGFRAATLWVMQGNLRARRFYEHNGWHVDGAERVDAIGDTPVKEVRYRRQIW